MLVIQKAARSGNAQSMPWSATDKLSRLHENAHAATHHWMQVFLQVRGHCVYTFLEKHLPFFALRVHFSVLILSTHGTMVVPGGMGGIAGL